MLSLLHKYVWFLNLLIHWCSEHLIMLSLLQKYVWFLNLLIHWCSEHLIMLSLLQKYVWFLNSLIHWCSEHLIMLSLLQKYVWFLNLLIHWCSEHLIILSLLQKYVWFLNSLIHWCSEHFIMLSLVQKLYSNERDGKMLMNHVQVRSEMKRIWPTFRYYPNTCLERLRNALTSLRTAGSPTKFETSKIHTHSNSNLLQSVRTNSSTKHIFDLSRDCGLIKTSQVINSAN
jgi:hypothetical protein